MSNMTRQKMNLTGQQYGRLTVLNESPQRGNARVWLCQCTCGQKKEILQTSLRGGTTKSCGCLLKEKLHAKITVELTGKQLGKWTVLKEAPEREKDRYWLCKCACGTEREVAQKGLISGNSQSCGCTRIKNLTGGTYGKLTVLKIAGKKGGRIYWHCECQCGNHADVRGESLKNGNTKSCGCLKTGPKRSSADSSSKSRNSRTKKRKKSIDTIISTAIKGVYFHKPTNTWDVYITIGGQKIYLGRFSNLKEALQKRTDAEKKPSAYLKSHSSS